MRVKVEEGVDLYVDVEGAGLVPDGETMRERPTIESPVPRPTRLWRQRILTFCVVPVVSRWTSERAPASTVSETKTCCTVSASLESFRYRRSVGDDVRRTRSRRRAARGRCRRR